MKRLNHFTAVTAHGASLIAMVSLVALFSLVAPFGSSSLVGQDFGSSGFGQSNDVFGGINFGALSDAKQEPVTWNAQYFASGGQGRLEIEAVVGRSWHIYSTTQPPGGPLATKFVIKSPSSVSIVGEFKPDEPPTKSVSDIYPGVTIEEHEGVVLWSAPIKLDAGFKGDIKVDVNALVCQNSGSCMPANETLTVAYGGPATEADNKLGQSTDQGADQSPSAQVRSSQVRSSQVRSSQVRSSQVRSATPAGDTSKTIASLLADAAAKPTTFRDNGYDVTWTAGVSSSIAAGQTGQLILRASPEPEFHVYQGVVDDSESSTNFVITEKSGLRVGRPQADRSVVSKTLIPGTPPIKYYKGEVTWSLPLHVPAGTAGGDHQVRGFICYQACTDTSCLRPMALEFVATVTVADATVATIGPVEIKSAKFATAIDTAAETDWVDDLDQADAAEASPTQPETGNSDANVDPVSATGGAKPDVAVDQSSADDNDASTGLAAAADDLPKASLPFILLMALCGGFILNFMPCVLPVIGIKVLSFVQQAGEDRGRIFMLNFAYVAGILTIFVGLAILAVVFSFGWGQQFAYFPVRIGLTVTIFALALSYLGVWELPTPGLATGKSSDELQKKEGLTGAFFTGAFATILATPCSGPFLGVALGYTLYLNSIESAAVIMTVGLGMSLPYIFLGLFPAAVGFLPKPGNWMVTLKEFLAFLFLGTVAYFFNQFSDEQKLPVFVTLIGVWFGCWIIGKVPPWESIGKRLRGWSIGVASAAAIGWLGFVYLERNPAPPTGGDAYIVDDHLRWEKYDEQRLQKHLADGKTVMLDFTAAWCPNCITNTIIALDTEPTSEALDEIGGVAMLADMTDLPEDIVRKLENEFGSKSIPLLAIYPGNSPNDPIVLRDIVTQSMVLDALEQAANRPGPSTAQRGPVAAERLTSTTTTSTAGQNH